MPFVRESGSIGRYDDEALRRLAFVALAREMGLDLAAIRSVLEQARDCPEADPLRDCPRLRGALDAVLAGVDRTGSA